MIHSADQWLFVLRRHQIRDQRGLWINSFLRQLAFALVGMFSAVFVYEFGKTGLMDGGVAGGLKLLMVYVLLIRLVILLLVIWVGNYVIRRLGYRKSVMLSLVITSLGFGFLAWASRSGELAGVVLGAVMIGLGVCGYWPMWYTLMPESETEERMGRAFGKINVVVSISQALAPVAAAVIIGSLGFDKLFGVGIGLLMMSGLPMFFLRHHIHVDEVNWREFFYWSRESTFLQAGVAIGGKYVNDMVYADLWPIYLLIVVGSINNLGWFKAVVVLAGAGFAYLMANLFDKKADKKLQLLGVSGNMLMWVLRLWPKEPLQLLMIDGVDRFFGSITETFFQGYALRRAKGPETFSFAVYRLVWESFWGVVTLVVLWMGLSWFGVTVFWVMAMAMAAVGMAMSMMMREHHKQALGVSS